MQLFISPYRLGINRFCSTISCQSSTSVLRTIVGKSMYTSRSYSTEPMPKIEDDKLHKLIRRSRLLTKLNGNPRYKKYFNNLSEAGAVSTVTSFLILHEITAVLPLFVLWGLLYSLDIHEQYELPVYFKDLLNKCGDSIDRLVGEYCDDWDKDRLILSGAISYAIVKLLYPVRIIFSFWAAPYMGKWIVKPFKTLKATLFR